ncbi:MAG TPA: PDZ domain-containing protein [Acidimicrobiales bacterium]|nr:PDZ domain-containing protein [Acidimicrobiales bacterium]
MAGWSENTRKSTARIAATTTARLTINPDTTDEIVLAGPDGGGGGEDDGWTRPAPRRRRWWLVPLILLGIAAVSAIFIRLPYDTIAPGSSRQVNDLVLIKGGPNYPPRGQIMETTVSVRERVTPYEVLFGWLSPDIDVISEKKVRGNTPPKVYEQQNVVAMSDSKKVAEAVALEHIGYHVVQGNGAVVRDVRPNTPGATILKPGDLIVGVDGKPVGIETQAVDAIHAHKPGDRVTLSVVRGKAAPQPLQATLASQGGQPFLGVVLETSGLQFKLPFDINIDSGTVVGPSAGAAYGLELLDQLTPGELTGGGKVAVTGELHLDGTIGAIGGVAQKAVTVRRSGASIFIVPRDNYKDAKAHAGNHLKVYAVDNFDDALRILGSLKGSNALSLVQPAPSS